jgi:single-stranded-DNA-specific exonuclease
LRALFQKAGISLTHLSEDDIVFSVTPRLNAASRMAHPDDAFKLLAAKDTRVGMVAAEHLSALNDDRKKSVAHIMKEVHARVAKRKLNGGLPPVLVMGDPSWPAGILGLVASKITEEYVVTTFVWGSEGEGETAVKGSCRGIGDVAVVELMEHSKEFLMQFGGHEDAGGFTTIKEHVHFLEGVLNKHYPALKKEQIKDNSIHYDTEGTLDMLTMKHYREMRKMAPFGMANPKPRFAFTALTVVSVKQFGKTKEHLELILSDSVRQARAISWYAHAESFSRKLETGIVVTLIAEFDYSVFRGKEELRLKIVDVL